MREVGVAEPSFISEAPLGRFRDRDREVDSNGDYNNQQGNLVARVRCNAGVDMRVSARLCETAVRAVVEIPTTV